MRFQYAKKNSSLQKTKPQVLLSQSCHTGFTPQPNEDTLRGASSQSDSSTAMTYFAGSFRLIRQSHHSHPRCHTGFTVIEAVVAVGVFAVAMTAMVGTFLAVLRVDEKSRSIRVVEQNARFIGEFLAREIRNGSLDYPRYSGDIPQPSDDKLLLINPGGNKERIFVSGTILKFEKIVDGVTYTTDLSTPEVTLTKVGFFISPETTPFLPSSPDEQPRVTFAMTLTSNTSARASDRISIVLQSTVSLRDYP